jgi:D-alanyl-D-alanine carboxypeptidase
MTQNPNPNTAKKHSPKLYILIAVFCLLVVGVIGYFGKFLNFSTNILATPVDPLTQYQHPLVPSVLKSRPPSLMAQSYIMIDVATNEILLSKNSSSRIYPASITKLATALTALNIYPLDEVVSVGSTYSEGKVMELKKGENITVRSLVTALLVYSANDAAYNLASHHRDGTAGFVAEMNLIAQKYNLKNTNFINYDGIHSPSHYSTVYDLSQLGRLAIKNPIIRETVKNKQLTVSDITGQINHQLVSTNELLGVMPEIQGLKTGWTPEAGGCFISLINIDGHEIIGVVAQSEQRFEDTQKLIYWAKENVGWLPYPQNDSQ